MATDHPTDAPKTPTVPATASKVTPAPIVPVPPRPSAQPEPSAQPVQPEPSVLAPELTPSAPTVPAKSSERLPLEFARPAALSEPNRQSTPDEPAKYGERLVLEVSDLHKTFGSTVAVDHISLQVPTGSIFGIVGPNGAGKTTTLSMITGLLRPDSGTITVHGADVWSDPVVAKRNMGVLPDRLRLFDRLTGGQLLYYAGTLRGLTGGTVKARAADLARAFGLEDALDRLVADYSAGMTKKIALACAMIHSPRVLILDEPFESVDPVSAANVTEILQNYVKAGGTVVLSSHSMDLVQRICDFVAIVVNGTVLASGTMDDVRGIGSLEEKFVQLAGGRKTAEGMEWLHSFSD